jgi:beta-xylosidase
VARARSLFGPWEKYRKNPLVAANGDWQCPGHGSIVATPDGRDFMLYHSYRKRGDTFGVGREALLDEVIWGSDGWPSINGGAGPSTHAPAPLGAGQRDEAGFFDDFGGAALGPEWQWPMNNSPSARVGTAGGSHLVLAPGASAPRADEYTAAVVARRTTSGDYAATALVDIQGTEADARAGLSAYGWRDDALGVALNGGRLVVWRREGGAEKRLAGADVPRSDALYLRMTAEGGERYRFSFSVDGRVWTEVGGAVDGGFIEGARVALTAAGGASRFDWVRIVGSDK